MGYSLDFAGIQWFFRLNDLSGITVVQVEAATEGVNLMQVPPNESSKVQGSSIQKNNWQTTDKSPNDEKTARLRQAVQSGSYQVNTQAVAQKILNSGILNQ